jgi:hypothetical protein
MSASLIPTVSKAVLTDGSGMLKMSASLIPTVSKAVLTDGSGMV